MPRALTQALVLFLFKSTAQAWEPTCPPEERFAVLYGDSFRAVCPAHMPSLILVLRGTSLDDPRPVTHDNAADIEDIYDGIPTVRGANLGAVQKVVASWQLDDDPRAATFLINYLFADNRDGYIRANHLSMSQVVAVTQYLGYLADARNDASKNRTLDRPIAPPTQVMSAAAAELSGSDYDLKAGDCADVANAQGDLLQKLGARDVVVVTSSLTTGLHSTVIARDPTRPQSYYHFNLGAASHSSAREGADLLQLPGDDPIWNDVGSGVYLNRPNGATVAWVPTNAGKLYAEVSGMDIHDIEPLARATSSLVGAQAHLVRGLSLQAFAARDSTGADYGGVGLRESWGARFPGGFGLVAGARHAGDGLNLFDLYLHIEQGVVTPTVRAGDWLRLDAGAKLILLGTYSVPFSPETEEVWGFGAAVLLDTGPRLTLQHAWFSATTYATLQLAPGVTNIAGSTPTVFVNHGVAGGEARARLGRRFSLFANGAAVFDFFGTRMAASVGVEGPRFGVRLEAMGRVVEDGAAYKEGSLRRGRLLVGVTAARWLELSAMGEVQEGVTDPRWILTGALRSRF